MSSIVIKGVEETKDRLAWRKGAARALAPAGMHVKGKISKYPTQKRPTRRSVYGFSFFSTRQRRKVMAMLREGLWPYRRTGSFGRRWAVKINIPSLTAVIGNATPYGPHVQGAPGQSLYMGVKGWKTTAEVAHSERTRVMAYFKKYIDKQLAGGK